MKNNRGTMHHRSGRLRVATFNIGHSVIEHTQYRDYIHTNYIDLVALQEVRFDKLHELCTDKLNHLTYVETDGGQINAIQSGMRLLDKVETSLIGKGEQRKLLKVSTFFKKHTLSFYTTHLDAAYDNSTRLAQLHQIKEIMDKDQAEYKILLGDFNIRDVSHFEILKPLKSLQGHLGTYFGTWDQSRGEWDSLCTDNILVTENIEFGRSCRVANKMKSDHHMLWVELQLKEDPKG